MKLADEQPDTFVLNLLGMPLNLTMTKAPELDGANNEIKLHVNGLF